MSFKEWLKINETGTFSTAPTGGVGDIAHFKSPVGIGIVRRNYPYYGQKQSKKRVKRA